MPVSFSLSYLLNSKVNRFCSAIDPGFACGAESFADLSVDGFGHVLGAVIAAPFPSSCLGVKPVVVGVAHVVVTPVQFQSLPASRSRRGCASGSS